MGRASQNLNHDCEFLQFFLLSRSFQTRPRFIRFINQTLFLLHHLVHSSKPIVRLHDKLQHCPYFDNLVHMFILSFGQLSYADPPDWIDVEGKVELECLVGTLTEAVPRASY